MGEAQWRIESSLLQHRDETGDQLSALHHGRRG
jgi:hypothetical protein